jgi:hypothetical protein
MEHVGWVLHLKADGGNDVFWWADKYPESPASGARPVYALTIDTEGDDA